MSFRYVFNPITQKLDKVSALEEIKAGTVGGASFAGTPLEAAVVFGKPFKDANYSITITGEDERSWTYSSKTTTGFVLQTNANQPVTGEVSWKAVRSES